MTKNVKLTIGEFSRYCQVTVKTLRHYERMGLLVPREVDEWTRYRYYDVSQMRRLNAIRQLKDMGFSLEEIRDLFEEDTHTPSLAQIEAKLQECERQLRLLHARRALLLKMGDSLKNVKSMEQISIQPLPAIIVASHRQVIKHYSDIGQLYSEVIAPELRRLGCRSTQPGYTFTVEHDGEYKPEDINIEFCEQVEALGQDSPIIQFRRIGEVPMAACMKCYGPYSRSLYGSYERLFRYIDEQGLRVCGLHRTSYVDGPWNEKDPEHWLTVLQVPVERP